nr:fad-dependent monooxygenase cctm [Quercus suber]
MTHWTDDAPPADSSEDRLRHFKRLGATYAEPFRSAMAMVDERTFVPYDRLKYWAEPTLWDNRNGRVTLAGDAAHPFPPREFLLDQEWLLRTLSILASACQDVTEKRLRTDRGQGLNNSFQDAANLVKTLADHPAESPLTDRMSSYDMEVLERGKREIEMSCQQAYASTHWDSFLRSPAVQFGLKRVDSLTKDILGPQDGSA